MWQSIKADGTLRWQQRQPARCKARPFTLTSHCWPLSFSACSREASALAHSARSPMYFSGRVDSAMRYCSPNTSYTYGQQRRANFSRRWMQSNMHRTGQCTRLALAAPATSGPSGGITARRSAGTHDGVLAALATAADYQAYCICVAPRPSCAERRTPAGATTSHHLNIVCCSSTCTGWHNVRRWRQQHQQQKGRAVPSQHAN